MITYPNCKINLGLHVLSCRADGFHNIETIMIPVSLCDILEIKVSKAGKTEITMSGLSVDGEYTSNICIMAYEIFYSEYPLPPVNIHLHKRIPVGAGLGGGSADGAFTLLMLNELFKSGLGKEKIKRMALKAGSDCPFFIENSPMIVTGRGEELTPIDFKLKGLKIVIIKPSFNINTANAYRQITPKNDRDALKDLVKTPVEKWTGSIVNDFEPFVLESYDEAIHIKDYLYESGAFFAQMSGSGSAFYGLYHQMPVLNRYLDERLIYKGELF